MKKKLFLLVVFIIIAITGVLAETYTRAIILVSVVEPIAPQFVIRVTDLKNAQILKCSDTKVLLQKISDSQLLSATFEVYQINDGDYRGNSYVKVDISGSSLIKETLSNSILFDTSYNGRLSPHTIGEFTISSKDNLVLVNLGYTVE